MKKTIVAAEWIYVFLFGTQSSVLCMSGIYPLSSIGSTTVAGQLLIIDSDNMKNLEVVYHPEGLHVDY